MQASQPFDLLWRLTLGEAKAVLRYHADHRAKEARVARARDHQLAQLIALAVNAPDKMPDLEAWTDGDEPEATATDLENFFVRLGQRQSDS